MVNCKSYSACSCHRLLASYDLPSFLSFFRLPHFRVNAGHYDAGIMQSPCCRAEEDPMNIVAPLLHRVFQCASKQPSFRITDCLCSSMPLQFSLCIFSMKTNRSESVQIWHFPRRDQGPDSGAKMCSFECFFESSFEYFSNSFVKEVFKGAFKKEKFCTRIGALEPPCVPPSGADQTA